MVYLQKYALIKKDGRYHAVADVHPACPDCGGPLSVRDSRLRRVIDSSGATQIFSLRRLQCRYCRRIHLEIPDILIPHKHYSKEAIRRALDRSAFDCPAEDSTIYRWRHDQQLPNGP